MMEERKEILYQDIPHFPVSTVEGHSGSLIEGKLNGIPVLVLSGRFHIYEGYSPSRIIFPIRVLHAFGIRKLVISNMAGGLKEGMQEGDICIISDHINLMGTNPAHRF